MTHQTAQQKARARNANPLGGKPAQLAPSHPVTPVVCATCGHPRLIHRDGSLQGRTVRRYGCLALACDCLAYAEETSNA